MGRRVLRRYAILLLIKGMRNVSKQRGFTLVEIMIVVTIIGILATLALPAFQRVTLRTRGTAFLNEGRVFAEAFTRYAQENGQFPSASGRANFPDEMEGYIKRETWGRTTPVGGNYSWDDYRNRNRSGHNGAIMVTRATLDMPEMRLIDSWLDDGNIRTGNIQVRAGGSTIYYMVEQ